MISTLEIPGKAVRSSRTFRAAACRSFSGMSPEIATEMTSFHCEVSGILMVGRSISLGNVLMESIRDSISALSLSMSTPSLTSMRNSPLPRSAKARIDFTSTIPWRAFSTGKTIFCSTSLGVPPGRAILTTMREKRKEGVTSVGI